MGNAALSSLLSLPPSLSLALDFYSIQLSVFALMKLIFCSEIN